MKKIILFLAALTTLGIAAYSQEDVQKAAADAAAAIAEAPQEEVAQPKPVYWTKSLMTNLNFAQTALWNWASGGANNYTMTGYVDANANYAKGKMLWNNRLQIDYGFLYSKDKPILQKVKDRIYFESKWGLETPIQHLSYSANFDFKTQIDNNYTYGTPSVANPKVSDWKAARTLKSGLFSPAYASLGLGLLWTPWAWFSLNVAPVTGGFVIVDNPELRKAYGMELENDGVTYKSSRFELGAQVKADANFTINDNLKYTTQLVLFSNYLKNPQNLRVNWDNKVFWKMAKFFTMTFSTNLIYDDTIIITNEDHPAGFRTIQFKEFFEIGFSYTIKSKK